MLLGERRAQPAEDYASLGSPAARQYFPKGKVKRCKINSGAAEVREVPLGRRAPGSAEAATALLFPKSPPAAQGRHFQRPPFGEGAPAPAPALGGDPEGRSRGGGAPQAGLGDAPRASAPGTDRAAHGHKHEV